MRAPFRWTAGAAQIDNDGKRQIAYTVRLPFTLGLSKLDFDDVPGIIDPGNLATASANVSLDADIPITRRFHIRPTAEMGYSTVIEESDRAWTYRVEAKTRTKSKAGKLDWALLFDLGIAGYEPNQGESDDFEFAAAGLEFGYPVNWLASGDGQSVLYWHLTYTGFSWTRSKSRRVWRWFDSVANLWHAGIAFGKRQKPIRIWKLKFDRLGLAYKFSDSSELRGIKFIFRSVYEL